MHLLEETMEEVIGNGRYQILLIFLALFVGIPECFMQSASVFISAVPESRCRLPLDDVNIAINMSENQIKELFIPWNDVTRSFDKCHQFSYNISRCAQNQFSATCIADVINSTSSPEIITCPDGYHFSHDVFDDTVATEWGLVCSRLTLKSISTSLFYLGILLGSLIGGILADKFGRVTIFKFGAIFSLASGIAVSFAPNITVFIILRFMLACFMKPVALSAVVYSIEICKQTWRAEATFGYNVFSGVGYIVMGGVATLWRSWRSLQIALSLFFVPVIIVGFFLPPSPRWLLSKGKYKKSKEILFLMAKRNKSGMSEEELDKLGYDSNGEHDESKPISNENSLKETFSRPYTRMITIGNMFVWMITSLIYYGLTLNSGALAGNIYLNHTLGGVMDVIACVSSIYIVSKWTGCKIWTVATLLIASVSCLLSTAIIYFWSESAVAEKVGIILAMFGRFGASAAFGVIYMHTVEMFPTMGRNTALGLASMAARVGSIISPFTLQIQFEIPWLTQAILGFAALFGAFIASNFPETKDEELFMTFEEVEDFFARKLHSKLLSKCCCIKLKRYNERSNSSNDDIKLQEYL